MDWYYRAGLAIGLIWAAARALGAYGDAARELDINFLFGFLLTTGGWSAVFLVLDWILRFLGLRPKRDAPTSAAPVATDPAPPSALPPSTPRAKRRRGR